MKTKLLVILTVFLFIIGFSIAKNRMSKTALDTAQANALGQYVVIGWNDLGMHCMGKYYQNLCILPPYNNLNAQVIHRGNPPQLVSTGVALNYRFLNNTSSAGKINFWSYAFSLFGVTLPDNIGLTGRGLTGTMSWNSTMNLWIADGVPLTGYNDGSTVEQPYQIAEVTLTFTTSTLVLDKTQFVAPVSVEMNCALCHSGGGGNVEQNILTLHDEGNGTNLMASRPVLCANCHASNALGKPGNPSLASLSKAMHAKHAEERPNTSCYNCHPGSTTQCLRGAMFLAGKTCTDCHGSLTTMAHALDTGRRPWLDEPKCASCHASVYAENAGKLYRVSKGHGNMYCSSCHNSPHAELPTNQSRDALQVQRLQGTNSYIRDCMVCHTVMPTSPGPHGYLPPTNVARWNKYL